MFILLCSPHSFFLIELLTTSLILIRFFLFFFLVALSLKSPTRGVSINYCIVLYCIKMCFNRDRKVQKGKKERYAVMFYMCGICGGVYRRQKQKEKLTQWVPICERYKVPGTKYCIFLELLSKTKWNNCLSDWVI